MVTDLYELKKLLPYKEDEAFRKRFMEIKYKKSEISTVYKRTK